MRKATTSKGTGAVTENGGASVGMFFFSYFFIYFIHLPAFGVLKKLINDN